MITLGTGVGGGVVQGRGGNIGLPAAPPAAGAGLPVLHDDRVARLAAAEDPLTASISVPTGAERGAAEVLAGYGYRPLVVNRSAPTPLIMFTVGQLELRHLRTTENSFQSAGTQGSMVIPSKSGRTPSRYWVAA